jgi:hypothetical protein
LCLTPILFRRPAISSEFSPRRCRRAPAGPSRKPLDLFATASHFSPSVR